MNDYQQESGGKSTVWADTFTFTANSHTLIAAMKKENGSMQTMITTEATRR